MSELLAAPARRVPAWALAVLAALPMWAVLYGGAFGARSGASPSDPPQPDPGVLAYRAAGCSGCHGLRGQGTERVPALTSTDETFPRVEGHVQWVREGSQAKAGQPYGAKGAVATGGMPGFGSSLSDAEILAIVCYERRVLSKVGPEPACSADE